MRLGIKILNSSSQVNSLSYLNQTYVNPGDTATIMFQLVDLDQPNSPRYMPSTPFTITAKLSSPNDANILNKIPTQPFAQDASIFSFNLSTSESKQIGSNNLSIVLSEGSNVKSATIDAGVIATPRSQYQC